MVVHAEKATRPLDPGERLVNGHILYSDEWLNDCAHCHGSGQERDMQFGLAIVCRDCSGSGVLS